MSDERRRRARAQAPGFTLIELVIVLAIIAILAGLLVPMAFQVFAVDRAALTEQELQAIYTAIVGTPGEGIFGYVGDVGNYPASLLDLVRQPVDAANAPLSGWKGPYLENPRIENGVWLDPYGRPYEYYQVSGLNTADRLAIVSRGPDGLSTATASAPGDAAQYAGPSPADPGYSSGANADNVIVPRVDGNSNALDVKTDGEVALGVLNLDSNLKLSALVPACPNFYTVTALSLARSTIEVNTPYVQGLSFNLPQGKYWIALIPRAPTGTAWADTVLVQPGTTQTRALEIGGLDSSATPVFDLTVKNGLSTDLQVFEFGAKLTGVLSGTTSGSDTIRAGETRVFTPHGCAHIVVRQKDTGPVVDQFVMPYGAFSRQEGTQAATLLVTNLFGHDHHDHGNGLLHHHQADLRPHGRLRLFVYRNDILLGTVNHHHKDVEFDDVVMAGDKIAILDGDGNVLASLTLVVGTNSVTVGG